jgi:biopolymer transport protein ExbB
MRRERRGFAPFALALALAGVAATTLPSRAAEESVAPPDAALAPPASADQDTAAVADSMADWGAGFQDLAAHETRGGLMARFAGSGAVEQFQKGGVFMWPILALLVVGVAVLIERFYTLSRARTDVRSLMDRVVAAIRGEGVEAAIEVCARTRGPVPAILHAGLRRASVSVDAAEKAIESAGAVELSFLERGLVTLATIANVAPLLGFLGTVSGMIHAFDAIAAADQVSAKLVASGIAEALITTLAGLVVAIPMSLAHNYFVSQVDRFVIEMHETSADLVDTLVDVGFRRTAQEGPAR